MKPLIPVVAAILLASPVSGALAAGSKPSREVLTFSAPPRENPIDAQKRYQPIASYLSRVLGKKVVYRNPRNWGSYRTEMLQGNYDIVFDGPHFNSYRAERMNHNILAKIPVQHQFVVITRRNHTRAKKIQDLAGHTICTHAPPNLGTLTLLNQFDNPVRQPAIINTKGWNNIYKGVQSGRCEAGVIPIANLKKYDPKLRTMRIVYKNPPIPNQAFSAGPRLSKKEQARLTQALVSDAAKQPTSELRAAYRVGAHFVPANNREYQGISEYLKNEWGYYE